MSPLQKSSPLAPSARTGVHIRSATRDDLAGLVELENTAFAIERMSARQLRRHLQSASASVLVATRERRIVGSAVLFFRRGNRVARLYSIAVAASERGGGLGAALLDAAERSARGHACSRMRLEVRVDNTHAQALYERRDYRRFGLHRGYYEDGHDALRYEKALD